MKLPRRKFLHLAAGVAALPALSRNARAQSYPWRPVRLIAGFPPGGPADIAARLMGQWLSDRFGRQFVVENRPGAAGNIATDMAAKAAGDGYTLLQLSGSNTINAALYNNLNFDLIRDIAPIGGIMRTTLVMLVNPAFGPKTVPEFIAFAKANPRTINMGSAGTGSVSHMSGELLKISTGIDMLHVPYRGEALALTDLLAGQIQTMFGNLSSSLEFLRLGKLRALAVTTATRSEALPGVPTVSEFVPGYEVSGLNAVGAPKGISRLNHSINAGLADPSLRARLAELGGTPIPGTPADLGKLLANETEKWTKVVRAVNIKPE